MHAGRYKRDLHEAEATTKAMQQELSERESMAAAEVAASEAELMEARQQLRTLAVQQPAASGTEKRVSPSLSNLTRTPFDRSSAKACS